MEITKKLKKSNKEDTLLLFEDIYNKYYKLLYFVAFSYLKEEQKTEDVVQDVFLTFFEKCINEELESQVKNIKSYLCSCVKNAALKEMKRQNKISNVEDIELFADLNKKDVIEINLRKILKDLDKETIGIINDHIFLNLSFKEIAKQSNSSINTIKSKYRRAIQKIRRKTKNESL